MKQLETTSWGFAGLTGMSFSGDDPRVHALMFIATPFLALGAIMLRDSQKN
ncbi:hypothetical protein [Corynebacterium ulceribovis]|uniref:hypothetical protein n=1 Tax=Corynebacterium ulceribovis TaxID=487732 RepID=UPI0012EADD9E|nr:hypothetical protein [Corynebacterium ulceribovis]